MRAWLLILSGLLCLGSLAPLAGPALAGHGEMSMTASDAPAAPACPDDCCGDCADFTQCQMGCTAAVLPSVLSDAGYDRRIPAEVKSFSALQSVQHPPATPPPRARQ